MNAVAHSNHTPNLAISHGEEEFQNAFELLVEDLSRVLGPSSGLDSEDVDPADIQMLMEQYTSNASEWLKYAFGDSTRGYTRNLVDKGNGKSNLLVLVWTPGKGSPIHDHANSHCVMKVLRGSLTETLYEWPDKTWDNSGPLLVKRETTYNENQVTYMSDQLGLHKITNTDPENVAVSLHLYTPPNAAKNGCYMFDEKTGAGTHVYQCNFFSEFGCKI